MYWTPAKMQLFADVGGYSFANTARLQKNGAELDFFCNRGQNSHLFFKFFGLNF